MAILTYNNNLNGFLKGEESRTKKANH